mmetsp:Transcript_38431/g.73871  ORF Transcript_38431/g.73871 Transcript_38431/m.73871 type:complete len:126 (+) Transcript_38431:221-598(+)
MALANGLIHKHTHTQTLTHARTHTHMCTHTSHRITSHYISHIIPSHTLQERFPNKSASRSFFAANNRKNARNKRRDQNERNDNENKIKNNTTNAASTWRVVLMRTAKANTKNTESEQSKLQNANR